jgi:adenylate cyclase ExoY
MAGTAPVQSAALPDESAEVDLATIASIHRVGFPQEHVRKLAALSAERQEIFAIRPVDPANRSLIQAGYPTKNLTIKPKSANWGPMAGFLPAKQALSKLEGQSADPSGHATVQKYQAEMDKLLSGMHTQKGTLKISQQRIAELIQGSHGTMESTQLDADIIHLSAQGPSGRMYQFEAVRAVDSQYAIHLDGAPLEVLCDLDSGLPIIADYDLLLCAPLLNALDGSDGVRQHQPDKRWTKVRDILPEQATEYPKGEISRRISDLADAINGRLDRTQNKLVHHGADQHNAHTELDANFPATFFLPQPLDEIGVSLGPQNGAVVVVENLEQLKNLIEVAKDKGYHFDFSRKWSPEVLGVKRSSFKEALERFESGEHGRT